MESEALKAALAAIERTPEQEALHQAATNGGPAAISTLRDLVQGDFARLNVNKFISDTEKILTPEQIGQLLSKLKARFERNGNRHRGVEWSTVESRLNDAAPEKLWSLNEMERTCGEPDVVGIVKETGAVEFWDFSKESPEGRRVVCYDRTEQKAEYSPKENAIVMAEIMGLGGILNRRQIKKLSMLVKGLFSNSWSLVDTSEEAEKVLGAYRNDDCVFVDEHYPRISTAPGGFHGWLMV